MNGISQALVELRAERDRIDLVIQVLEDLGSQPRRLALGEIVPAAPAREKRGAAKRRSPRAVKATRGGGKLAGKEPEIQRRYVAGENVKALAAEMGCKDASIHGMAKRRGWVRKAGPGPVKIRRIPRGVSGRAEA